MSGSASSHAIALGEPTVAAAQLPLRVPGTPPRQDALRRAERLRIALLAPVWFPVPPPRYGGIEAVVALLVNALKDAGHDVTLFASGDSRTEARLSWVYAQAQSERLGEPLPELRHVFACYERATEFDVINDHRLAWRRDVAFPYRWSVPAPMSRGVPAWTIEG